MWGEEGREVGMESRNNVWEGAGEGRGESFSEGREICEEEDVDRRKREDAGEGWKEERGMKGAGGSQRRKRPGKLRREARKKRLKENVESSQEEGGGGSGDADEEEEKVGVERSKQWRKKQERLEKSRNAGLKGREASKNDLESIVNEMAAVEKSVKELEHQREKTLLHLRQAGTHDPQ